MSFRAPPNRFVHSYIGDDAVIDTAVTETFLRPGIFKVGIDCVSLSRERFITTVEQKVSEKLLGFL